MTVSGPETPTHFPQNDSSNPDVLDIAVCKKMNHPLYLEVIPDSLGSDHNPVLATLQEIPTRTALPKPRRLINWKRFQEELLSKSLITSAKTADEINSLAEQITQTTQNALTSATKEPKTSRILPPLPNYIGEKIRRKRKLRHQWQENRCPSLKNTINRLSSEIKSDLEKIATESWDNRLQEAEDD